MHCCCLHSARPRKNQCAVPEGSPLTDALFCQQTCKAYTRPVATPTAITACCIHQHQLYAAANSDPRTDALNSSHDNRSNLAHGSTSVTTAYTGTIKLSTTRCTHTCASKGWTRSVVCPSTCNNAAAMYAGPASIHKTPPLAPSSTPDVPSSPGCYCFAAAIGQSGTGSLHRSRCTQRLPMCTTSVDRAQYVLHAGVSVGADTHVTCQLNVHTCLQEAQNTTTHNMTSRKGQGPIPRSAQATPVCTCRQRRCWQLCNIGNDTVKPAHNLASPASTCHVQSARAFSAAVHRY
jgi:hypothetical protein